MLSNLEPCLLALAVRVGHVHNDLYSSRGVLAAKLLTWLTATMLTKFVDDNTVLIVISSVYVLLLSVRRTDIITRTFLSSSVHPSLSLCTSIITDDTSMECAVSVLARATLTLFKITALSSLSFCWVDATLASVPASPLSSFLRKLSKLPRSPSLSSAPKSQRKEAAKATKKAASAAKWLRLLAANIVRKQ